MNKMILGSYYYDMLALLSYLFLVWPFPAKMICVIND